MQGKKQHQEKLFNSFQLSEYVPAENFYRQLKSVLDLQFMYKATRSYYGSEGQQSIDPTVFFKLILVGYLENLNSDRKIIAHAKMRLDILYFIGYDLGEELPWHSTLSRTRQLFGEHVFLQLFKQVLKMCIDKGMVGASRQAVDSAYIKANASMDSIVEKQVLDDAQTYTQQLQANDETITVVKAEKRRQVEQHHNWKKNEYKNQPQGRKKTSEDTFDDEREADQRQRGKFLSNHTHYSTTDSDARISVKPGKPRQLTYSAQTCVDTAHHVITNIMADYSSKRDSESLAQLLNQTIANLNEHQLVVKEILADTGYSSGSALKYLEAANLTGYIPNFGQYKPERKGFVFNKEKDQYQCIQQGGLMALLPHKRTGANSKGYIQKTYRSSETVCKHCPLKQQCIGKSNFKKLDQCIDKPLYDQMHQRLQTRKAKIYKKLRCSTVEPVLGTLINFTGMRRIWTRGLKNANKFIIGAGIAYNLKKYMRFINKKRISVCMQLEKQTILTTESLFSTILMLSQPIQHYKSKNIFQIV